MPSQGSFGIENEKAWAAALESAYDDLKKDGEEEIRRTADKVVAVAKAKVPRDTGRLADSIEAREGRDAGGLYIDVGPGDLPNDYDVLVEHGTSDTEAQPFMRPALAEGEAAFGRQ